ncbi:PssE/Cps14G family polysaccharide biosynthesis glycosyltransferase [Colwelliaceae bacterium 6471]
MKIFVTVGNTQYNQLIEALDNYVPNDKYEVVIQLADGFYRPKNHQYFRFTQEVQKYYQEADLVVSHAGAGSVFNLLSLNKKLVVVPNFERVDDHQLDLANFIDKNRYACVCFDLTNILSCINKAYSNDFESYQYQSFSGFEQINELLLTNRICRENNNVGGISVDLFKDTQQLINHILDDNGNNLSGSAIAINPEKIVKSMQAPLVKEVLLSATIRYPDGIGVVKTLCRKTGETISRIPGVELWEGLMVKSGQVGASVYVVGASEDVISATCDKLKEKYNTPVVGYRNGYFSEDEEFAVIEELAAHKPKIVAVAMGSPKQELFIDKCRQIYPDAFYMGVGGSFDVFTEKVKRAPLVYRRLNLEWFYRVIKEPKRIFRHGNLFRYLYLELVRRL